MTSEELHFCPYCRLVIQPNEKRCSRCGRVLDTMDLVLAGEPSTDETLTIYRERGGPRVLTFAHLWLEYAAPDIAFRTRWENLTTIYCGLWASELYMLKEPYIMRASSRHRRQLYRGGPEIPAYPARRFALDPFGYPQHTELCADLGRRAPQLVPYLPKRT